jgi:hypothetical protein
MKRKKTTRRIWRAGVGMVAVALAVVAIWREWPRERLLIEVARPIVKMDAEKTSVCWRSTRQLLIVTTEQGAPTPIQTWKLEFPMGAILQRAKVSPQQRAIFFDRAGSQLSPLLIWLHRMIPKFNPKPTINEALWVSHADGRGLREVGYVPAQPGVSGSPTDGLKDVQWLPDGKQVSFVYHGTLYVVPAVPGK